MNENLTISNSFVINQFKLKLNLFKYGLNNLIFKANEGILFIICY